MLHAGEDGSHKQSALPLTQEKPLFFSYSELPETCQGGGRGGGGSRGETAETRLSAPLARLFLMRVLSVALARPPLAWECPG